MIYILVAIGIVAFFFLTGGSVGRGLRFGRTLETLEAPLERVGKSEAVLAASGKAKRRRYEDGNEWIRVQCVGLRHGVGTPRPPMGAPIDVMIGNVVVATVPLSKGRIRMERRSWKGEEVPPASGGTSVFLCYDGVVLLEGAFEAD